MKKHLLVFTLLWNAACFTAQAQSVLFDFNDAPLHSPFPISITKGGITAHFAGIGYNYSIQDMTAPVAPIGFSGRDIYPSTVYQADLVINYDKVITDFSILYSCQELGCDDAATMRVTAYKNGALVGTNTHVAKYPGTWPVDTLSCSFLSGFDSVVVHYDHRPPTCQDYGVIFLCDDMRVTAQTSTFVREQQSSFEGSISPNPATEPVIIDFKLAQPDNIHLGIYDMQGRLVRDLFAGQLNKGLHEFSWDPKTEAMPAGLYFLRLDGESLSQTARIVVLK